MANTKYIRGLSGRGFRVKNSAGTWVTVKEGVQALVDLEVDGTQTILSRERDNFVRVANAATVAVIKPLHRRGFRLTPRGGTVTISNASPGVVTFTAHGLKANDAVVFSTTGALPAPLVASTTYYVKTVATADTFTLSATPGGTVIDTTDAGSGTHTIAPQKKNVTQDSDVTVNLNDGETKRFLKRNFGRYIVLATAGDTVQSIVGLQDAQNSFRVEDPVLVMEFAGANNNLTWVPKTPLGELVTVELIDPGTNETPISASVVDDDLDNRIQVELDITQNVQASLTTSLTGTNNDIVWTAQPAYAGTAGHAIEIEYIDPPGNNVPISVAVVGTVIEVTLATDGSSAITSTADNVKAAVAASPEAAALVTGTDAGGNDGSGVVTALAQTALAGGVNEVVRSTAADVVTEIGLTAEALALVTVTAEGNGLGLVAPYAETALGDDAENLGRGEVVSNVDLTDSFNVGQLRRRFKAWVEN